jgi:hypothetical protein
MGGRLTIMQQQQPEFLTVRLAHGYRPPGSGVPLSWRIESDALDSRVFMIDVVSVARWIILRFRTALPRQRL